MIFADVKKLFIPEGEVKSIACNGATLWGAPTSVVILKQPQSVVCSVGDTISFTVEAEGVASYQWQYSASNGVNWANLTWDGATTATMTGGVTNTRMGFLYRCALTGEDGTVVYTDVVQMIAAAE